MIKFILQKFFPQVGIFALTLYQSWAKSYKTLLIVILSFVNFLNSTSAISTTKVQSGSSKKSKNVLNTFVKVL
jgi:hypothetical protein